jgi:hypothetical protein
MCTESSGGEASQSPSALGMFDPTIKCCTYLPELHNFLVGRVLADDSPESAAGRATVEARIRSRVALTPLGLGKPRSYQVLYRNQGRGDFGRTQSFRCPHYLEGGLCGVWRHRESTCATWFCKHQRGQTGLAFWRTLHRLLQSIERSLARRCVLDLDPGAEALEILLAHPDASLIGISLDSVLDPALERALWGSWAGRAEEYFKECARIVEKLPWDSVMDEGGSEVRLNAHLVREAWARLASNVLPERLILGRLQIVSITRDSARVATYSPLDTFELQRTVLDALSAFDGRPTTEVLARLERENHLRLAPEFVRRLVDFNVLVPAEKSSARVQETV